MRCPFCLIGCDVPAEIVSIDMLYGMNETFNPGVFTEIWIYKHTVRPVFIFGYHFRLSRLQQITVDVILQRAVPSF